MLHREHSAILSTFIKLPFVIKIFVLPIFEWPLKTYFTLKAAINVCTDVSSRANWPTFWSESIPTYIVHWMCKRAAKLLVSAFVQARLCIRRSKMRYARAHCKAFVIPE